MELVDAVDYHEPQLVGLGQRLWDEVDQHVTWISENPEVPQLRVGGYRRLNFNVFLYFYYLAYIVRDSVIWILAIAHGHSRRNHWIDRIE